MVAITIGWAYVALRINSDYVQTLESERNHLRGVGATLRSATIAMLNDGVGAAVAGVNRELQILHMIGKGTSTRETAKLLHLSIKTIESHRQRIKRKLNLRTGVQLLRYAVLSQAEALPNSQATPWP